MSSIVEAPIDLIESVADLRFPPRAYARVRVLMVRNTNGLLSSDETAELEAWVEMSENLALVRAPALRVLGRMPT